MARPQQGYDSMTRGQLLAIVKKLSLETRSPSGVDILAQVVERIEAEHSHPTEGSRWRLVALEAIGSWIKRRIPAL